MEHGDDLAEYRRWLLGQLMAKNTVDQRVKFAQTRLREWGTLAMEPADIAEWLDRYHGWTRRTYLNHLRSIYAWMVESGRLEESPVARFRTPPEPAANPQPLSQRQIELVVENAEGDLLAWCLLGLLAGLRCHEIVKFRGEDINDRALYVVGKGGQEAVLPTHPLLWELAQDYPRRGWWFPSRYAKRAHISEAQVYEKIRTHFRDLGITHGSVHRLRHSFGSSLNRNKVGARTMQSLMRHKSLETTQRYVEVDFDQAAEAVRLLRVA